MKTSIRTIFTVFVFASFMLFALCPIVMSAANSAEAVIDESGILIEGFSGIMTITTLDGEVINITSKDQLKYIPLGAKIELISGSADLKIKGMDIFLKKGHKVQISQDLLSGAIEFDVLRKNKGNITVNFGATVLSLNRDDIVSVKFDELSGRATILAVLGEIDVTTPQGKLTLLEGSDTQVNIPKPQPETGGDSGTGGNQLLPEPKDKQLQEASPSLP